MQDHCHVINKIYFALFTSLDSTQYERMEAYRKYLGSQQLSSKLKEPKITSYISAILAKHEGRKKACWDAAIFPSQSFLIRSATHKPLTEQADFDGFRNSSLVGLTKVCMIQ